MRDVWSCSFRDGTVTEFYGKSTTFSDGESVFQLAEFDGQLITTSFLAHLTQSLTFEQQRFLYDPEGFVTDHREVENELFHRD